MNNKLENTKMDEGMKRKSECLSVRKLFTMTFWGKKRFWDAFFFFLGGWGRGLQLPEERLTDRETYFFNPFWAPAREIDKERKKKKRKGKNTNLAFISHLPQKC